MQINHDYNTAAYTIRSYHVGSIVIAKPLPKSATDAMDKPSDMEVTTIEDSVVVTPERLLSAWPPRTHGDLQPENFEMLLELQPELVILGTGKRLKFPPPSVTAPLLSQGIGVEVMDTAAACRTYNFLMADGRRVAAALLMIENDPG